MYFTIAMVGLLILGTVTMIGAFVKMKSGVGPMNIRFAGIILISTIAGVLALADITKAEAPIGILGAVAGYLFGFATKSE